jgi:hypothetical protein
VDGLQTRAVSSTAPNDEEALIYDTGGVNWRPRRVDNKYLTAAASADTALTTTYADVTGATITLDTDGTWLIMATASAYVDSTAQGTLVQLVYDGTAQTSIIRIDTTSAAVLANISGQWIVAHTGSKVAKLQARNVNGTSGVIKGTDTRITAVWLHP